MITNNDFFEATKKFDELEKRGSFYDMAIKLINSNFEIEAYFLILGTWNFARFRYAVNTFDINDFKEKIKKLTPLFNKFKNENFRTINFDNYKKDIQEIFDILSSIKGIEFTGTSKLMHLRCNNVFVMWDGYIKGEKLKKHYNQLDIVKNSFWTVKKYYNNSENYFEFLKSMQEQFKHISFNNSNKTFAKAIDEYNYVNITLPIQKLEKIK